MQDSAPASTARSSARTARARSTTPASADSGAANDTSPEPASQPARPSTTSGSSKKSRRCRTERIGASAPAFPPRRRPGSGAGRDCPRLAKLPDVDLRDPALYLNRELTWLEFNRRVLNEAEDERTPLLERVKFLAIVSSNLDEFFMKRIGGLKQQVGAGVQELTVDGRTPQQQIDEAQAVVSEIERRKERLLPEVLGRPRRARHRGARLRRT